MSTRSAYLFGGPANGSVVEVEVTATSLEIPEPRYWTGERNRGAELAPADPIATHLYESTGDTWYDDRYGPVVTFLHRGAVPLAGTENPDRGRR
ncbi:hypothetical protein [Actinosynnema sp. NPDC020468]|uniref:hypothetical protein n=1 Tax=Actinosynnema sp. NPDC020468 TaxID=3154488 RepID=UPI003405E1BB